MVTDSTSATVEADAAPVRPSRMGPLRHKVFAALWMAQLASYIGSFMQGVAGVWLMGTLGGSAFLVASMQTAQTLPAFLAGVPAGALADMLDRKRLLVVTQGLLAATAGVMALLAWLDQIRPSNLLALTFLMGIFSALTLPAYMAILPDLVPASEVREAIAVNSITANAGRAVGPALGGLLLAAAGAEVVFLVNAISFLGTLFVLMTWKYEKPPNSGVAAERLVGAVRAGLRYSVHWPPMRRALIRTAAIVLPTASLYALLPIVARERLGLDASGFGWLFAGFGGGAIVGGMILLPLGRRFSSDALMALAAVALAAAALVMGLVDDPWIVGAALVPGGAGWTISIATLNVSSQNSLPAWVRARGMALFLLMIQGGLAVGSLVWGALIEPTSVRTVLVAASVLTVLSVTLSKRWPLTRTELDLSPASERWPEPVVNLDITSDAGPVLVTVEYRVLPSKIDGFREAMRRVERQRRRTGAQRWYLWQDTSDGERFVEMFFVDSWEEHMRQHERVTEIDAQISRDAATFAESYGEVRHYLSS